VAASPDLTTKADQVALVVVELITPHSTSTAAVVVEPLSETAGVALAVTAEAVKVVFLYTERGLLLRRPSRSAEAVVEEQPQLATTARLASLDRTASSSLLTKFKDRT
jgi:hypothetical protein